MGKMEAAFIKDFLPLLCEAKKPTSYGFSKWTVLRWVAKHYRKCVCIKAFQVSVGKSNSWDKKKMYVGFLLRQGKLSPVVLPLVVLFMRFFK